MYLLRQGGSVRAVKPINFIKPPKIVETETTKNQLEKVVKNKPAMDKVINRLQNMKIKKKKIAFEI